MGVVAHHSYRELIGDAVIDAQADSAGGEVVPLCIPIAVHIDKVTESSHPHAPAIFRCVLEDRFHNGFGGFSVRVGSVLQIHRGAVDLHVGTEPAGSVVDIVQPTFQVQLLNVRVRKADLVKSRQAIGRNFIQVTRYIGHGLVEKKGNELRSLWIEGDAIKQVSGRALIGCQCE